MEHRRAEADLQVLHREWGKSDKQTQGDREEEQTGDSETRISDEL